MAFSFPNLPKITLWDLACLHTGQNATDDRPTNETRHKLAELAQAVFAESLWVEFDPDVGFDFIRGFMPAAARARVDTEWRKLDHVTVRREDWERYEKALANSSRQRAIDAKPKTVFHHAGTVLLDEESLCVPNGGSVTIHSINDSVATEDMGIVAGVFDHDLLDEQPQNGISGGSTWIVDEAVDMSPAPQARRLRGEVHPEPRMPVTTAELINEQATYWERRQPAPLYAGAGYSEELLKQTTLTKYLQYDTWTPAAAALLVSGLQAPIIEGQLCTETPNGKVQGLDGAWKSDTFRAIADAKRVLGIWRAQKNPPATVSPFDFIVWCKANGVDTVWLSNIEDAPQGQKEIADAWLRRQKAREQLPPTVIEEALGKYGTLLKVLFSPAHVQVDAPTHTDANEPLAELDARELSSINLTVAEYAHMTPEQRQSVARAVAETNGITEQIKRQTDERNARGRYTLSDAAKEIAMTGERFEVMLAKLCAAAQTGGLPMHAPGEQARYEYTNGRQVRPFYEEAHWDDLNTWLKRDEKRITYQFPEPDVHAEIGVAPDMSDFDEHWTIAEAAKVVGTDDAGVYERFLDGRLKASVFFAKEAPAQLVKTSNPLWLTDRGDVKASVANELRRVRYVWDLTLYDDKKLYHANLWVVRCRYFEFKHGTAVDAPEAQFGIFVQRGNEIYRLMQSQPVNGEVPHAQDLPDGAVLVVRRSELAAYAASRTSEPAIAPPEQATGSTSPADASQRGGGTHKLRAKRHALSHVIEMAKEAASERGNYQSVWSEMMRLAESNNRPAPLMGYVDGEGVKYQTDKGVKFFTKDALRKQMEPNAR